MNWIDLAKERNRWRAVVDAVMNLRVRKMQGISWLAENLLASEEGLCFMDTHKSKFERILHQEFSHISLARY